MKDIEIIKNKDDILAIIIYGDFCREGVNFFTPDDFPQQIGSLSHKAGKIIEPHIHKAIKREIYLTQEVLMLKKGKIKVDFYDSERNYFASRILRSNDVISLTGGGHGFEVLEDADIIEVKQGPYLGKDDKTLLKNIETG